MDELDPLAVRVNRADGQLHVSWNGPRIRESVTVDERVGRVTNSRGRRITGPDAAAIGYLIATRLGDAADELVLRLWLNYRYVFPDGPLVLPPADIPDHELAALFDIPWGAPYYDKRLQPMGIMDLVGLGYSRLSRVRVADRLPPFLVFDVSTIWLGHNIERHDHPPMVFETMIFGECPAAEATSLHLRRWTHPSEPAAMRMHDAVVESVTSLMNDPVLIPDRGRGKQSRTKPFRGMSARMRQAAVTMPPRSSGQRRVRGRRGEPDSWITWDWDAEQEMYRVERLADPVLPRVAARRHPRRQRRRRS